MNRNRKRVTNRRSGHLSEDGKGKEPFSHVHFTPSSWDSRNLYLTFLSVPAVYFFLDEPFFFFFFITLMLFCTVSSASLKTTSLMRS